MWESLVYGLSIAATPMNVIYCFLGCLYGTFVGVLPGFGPAAAISVLLPITFGMNPASAVIMLAGIYYGAQYGGSTTSILVNIPGEVKHLSLRVWMDTKWPVRAGQAQLS